MRRRVNRPRSRCVWSALAAWVNLTCMASCCLSGDEAPAGGRVEHPERHAPMPVSSAERAQDRGSPPGESFSPLDQAIAGDCDVLRDWSQNVPDRDCTHDTECGDGFCDRGHCAAVRTCDDRYGQRCINSLTAPSRWKSTKWCNGICLEGRCRSCETDAECVNDRGSSGLVCNPFRERNGRGCGMPAPTINRPVPSQ
jgi:hypothetical protein